MKTRIYAAPAVKGLTPVVLSAVMSCYLSNNSIYFHFHYNVLGGYHVSDFKSLNDGLLLN